MLVTVTGVSFLLLSFTYSVAGNCLVGGCGAGLCCSAYGFCGNTVEHCRGGAVAVPAAPVAAPAGGGCRATGCAAGQCCSQYGYCGTTAEHCGGVVAAPAAPAAPIINGGSGNCRATGCPAGSCCSAHGFCGNSAAHCAGISYGGCGATGCGAGMCCSQFGYCGASATHCAIAKFLSGQQPASLEGKFQGQATYYNETMASSDYTTCGTSRARSLDENSERIYTAALNEIQFDPYTVNGIPSTNPVCQKKAIAKGINGEIVIQFVDRCLDCKEGDIALTYDGFMAVAGDIGNGHTSIEWRFL
ncbi:unnamed protein product [Adineta steineri]|uniref:Chitin-binding type-1 domain-containing protein n=1 Tax=Adineta steineri TaxID=433720 RepID=A0A819IHU7_9BILA|nr:unnamed protein product [Adineta steineri]CAF3916702.1 unnamed protein product [Adineta steineri]